jgi:hypothetical protein
VCYIFKVIWLVIFTEVFKYPSFMLLNHLNLLHNRTECQAWRREVLVRTGYCCHLSAALLATGIRALSLTLLVSFHVSHLSNAPGSFPMLNVWNCLWKAFVRYSCQVIFPVCFCSLNGFIQFQIVYFFFCFLIYFLVNSQPIGITNSWTLFCLISSHSPMLLTDWLTGNMAILFGDEGSTWRLRSYVWWIICVTG